MKHSLIVLAIAGVVGPALPAQQPIFKGGVDVVTVPVTVTSLDQNTYVDGLTAADFRLSENGERQEVTTVTRARRALGLGIVVDDSGSMALGNRRELAVEAAQRLTAALKPEDEIAIVFFGKKVDLRLPWTRIREIARLNWSGWVPIGATPLNDGMRLGLDLIEKAHNPRRAVMLLTDGFEKREPRIHVEHRQDTAAERDHHLRLRRRFGEHRRPAIRRSTHPPAPAGRERREFAAIGVIEPA